MLAEADFGLTQMAFDQDRGGPGQGDEKLLVMFHNHPHLDKDESKKQGRPIFTSKEYVTIMVPGDKNNIVRRPVWDKDRQRWPKQYQAFLNKQEQNANGTLLETVPWITREQVEELKYFNVRTLENLADMPDIHAQKFMGINALRQKARDQIALAKEQAPALRLAAELRERDDRIAVLEKQLAEIAAKLPKTEAKK